MFNRGKQLSNSVKKSRSSWPRSRMTATMSPSTWRFLRNLASCNLSNKDGRKALKRRKVILIGQFSRKSVHWAMHLSYMSTLSPSGSTIRSVISAAGRVSTKQKKDTIGVQNFAISTFASLVVYFTKVNRLAMDHSKINRSSNSNFPR